MKPVLCPAVRDHRILDETAGEKPPRSIRVACEDAGLSAAANIAAAIMGAVCGIGINREAAFSVTISNRTPVTPQNDAEAYTLELTPVACTITAISASGLHHAFATLAQIFINGQILAQRIEDTPKLAQRGYMLDISRDRVPAHRTLLHLLDALWLLKYNQLQLYTEHTFAFSGHETVWKNASPLHPSDVAWIQDQCEARGIELVPNMNSLGHFGRWLEHPEYRHLSECPDGCTLPNGRVMPVGGTTLYPCPETLDFLGRLYDEFLPLFHSTRFNAGMDEPWELGLGRSRELCEKIGKHRVYLDHLNAVAKKAAAHGKTLQFWADIVLEAPEKVPELPKNVTGMIWGYEAGHPFETQCAAFEKAGVPFIVCPGTSCWNSIAGRWLNARENITQAAAAATAHRAQGMLLTDWGDNGHHQPPCTSLPPLALFADTAWNGTPTIEMEAVLDTLLLRDRSKGSGKALIALSSIAERHFKTRLHNCTTAWKMFFAPEEELPTLLPTKDQGQLHSFRMELALIRKKLAHARPATFGSGLVREELDLAARMLNYGAWRMEHALEWPDPCPEANPEDLAGDFETLWLRRSERGGLTDSLARMPAIH